MRAYVRAQGDSVEHALDKPLTPVLGCVADHLGSRCRATFDRIAKLDRERTPGEHSFDRLEMLDLIATAHTLLADPPAPLRRLRRVTSGPLPGADPIGALAGWLRECREVVVVYDLWKSQRDGGD